MQSNLITSWDDGSPYDLELAGLLDKYRIPGIFYVPINNPEREVMTKSQIRQLASRFEIGGHTLSHVDLTSISPEEAKNEILKGKNELEDIIGRKINKFCFPKGKYNNNILEIVKEAGFKSARTARIFYMGEIKESFLENPNLHVYNHEQFTYMGSCIKNTDLKSLVKASTLTQPDFLHVARECYKPGFHIWGHSWEVKEMGLWKSLANFMEFVNSK